MQSTTTITVDATSPLTILQYNLPAIGLLLAGAVTGGLTTIVNLLFNGVFLGIAVGDALERGLTPLQTMLLVAPHAVVELPALWLAAAIGLRPPLNLLLYLRGDRDTIVTSTELSHFLRLTVLTVALIAFAAVIEARLTPVLAGVVG